MQSITVQPKNCFTPHSSGERHLWHIAMLLHIFVVVAITLTRLHRHLFGRWHLIIECDIIILRFGSGKASSTHHWAHSAQGICWQSVQLNVIKKWSPCIIWFSYCHLKLSVFWNRTNTQTYDNTYLDAVTWFGIMKYTRLNSHTHTLRHGHMLWDNKAVRRHIIYNKHTCSKSERLVAASVCVCFVIHTNYRRNDM